MPRRELLTSSERLELLAFPTDEGELIRLYSLTKADLAFVRQHRGDHNRLGIAVLMSYLRYPGRVLAGDERPHGRVLDIVAGQLGIPVDVWDVYAERDATRREPSARTASSIGNGAVRDQALPVHLGVARTDRFANHARNGSRTGGCGGTSETLIVLPPVAVIERLCAEAMTRAQRKVFALLTEGLDDEQRSQARPTAGAA